MLPIIRAAIFRQDSSPASLPVTNSWHDSGSLARLLGRLCRHWIRDFLFLQATHSPAVHATDGFITPHAEQLHSPDPPQCQHVAVAGKWVGVALELEGGFLNTAKIAGFESRTRANNASSNARLGLRQRMSPSTVTLTPRPRSSVKISAT
jgi:hypothetical protein